MNRIRNLCRACLQPAGWCYCEKIQSFNPRIKFVILLHPLERRRRIATGRMSKLILEQSEIIYGFEFSNDRRVLELMNDPKYFPVVLFPDVNCTEIDKLTDDQKTAVCPKDRVLLIFVVDGTWSTASKTVRRSSTLQSLPKISFTPKTPSDFRVRTQPKPLCYSTIEAIHQTIDIFGNTFGFEFETRMHDNLLDVFRYFVDLQVEFVKKFRQKNGTLRIRTKTKKQKFMSKATELVKPMSCT